MEPIVIIAIVVAVVLVLVGGGWYVVSARRPDLDIDHSAPPTGSAAGSVQDLAPAGFGQRLTKTSRSFGGALRSALGRGSFDTEFWDGMEEALIGADIGVAAASDIIGRVRAANPEESSSARSALERELRAELAGRSRELHFGDKKPAVILVVGVNGAGKTTSIAKLAHRFRADGLVPLLGAADTFRAAADTQLRTWGDRLAVEVVGGQEGADPAAVAFDAYKAGRARGADVVMIDTAGRLQSKNNLMAELGKIRRVVERESDTIDEVLLVLDATAGQNGISQVREFAHAVGVTGIVLTKLDGTARGGVVVAIERELGVPVKFVGLGESVEDLIVFDPDEFVKAMLADA